MFNLSYKDKSIKNFWFKNKNITKFFRNENFHKILIKNKKNCNEPVFKLHKWKKKYQSISNLNKVCMLTGRSRSIISPYLFKRQIFKIQFMKNNIPNMIKNKF